MRPILAEAVELARRALLELQPLGVGEHLGVTGEDEYAATHHFAATLPGYGGWQWAVVVAAPPAADHATVSESALLPGPDALVAPDFLPWDQRVRPGDLAPGDLLATSPDDPRLVPGYLLSGDPVVDEAIEEIGLGRPRVLSLEGREEAAGRWYSEYGPDTDMARAAPSTCGLCGFFVPVAGALRAAFGVCANAMGADGHVVHTAYGCGAHSDTELPTGQGSPLYEAYDDAAVDMLPTADLRRPTAAPAPDAAPTSEDSATAAEIDPNSGPGAAASTTTEPSGPADEVESFTATAGAESAAGAGDVEPSAEVGRAESSAEVAGDEPSAEVAGAESSAEVAGGESSAEVAGGESSAEVAGAQLSVEVGDVEPSTEGTGVEPSAEVADVVSDDPASASGAETVSVGEVGISAGAASGAEENGVTGDSPVAVGTAAEADVAAGDATHASDAGAETVSVGEVGISADAASGGEENGVTGDSPVAVGTAAEADVAAGDATHASDAGAETVSVGEVGISADAASGGEENGVTGDSPVAIGTAAEADVATDGVGTAAEGDVAADGVGTAAVDDVAADGVGTAAAGDVAAGDAAHVSDAGAEVVSVGEVGISAGAGAGGEENGVTGDSPVAVGTAAEAGAVTGDGERGVGAETPGAQSVSGSEAPGDSGAEAATVADVANEHGAVAESGAAHAEPGSDGESGPGERSGATRYDDAWAVSAVRVRPDESGVAGSN